MLSFVGKGLNDALYHSPGMLNLKSPRSRWLKNGSECQERNLLVVVLIAKGFRVQEYFGLYQYNSLMHQAQVTTPEHTGTSGKAKHFVITSIYRCSVEYYTDSEKGKRDWVIL